MTNLDFKNLSKEDKAEIRKLKNKYFPYDEPLCKVTFEKLKLPENQQKKARRIGLILAGIMRLALLGSARSSLHSCGDIKSPSKIIGLFSLRWFSITSERAFVIAFAYVIIASNFFSIGTKWCLSDNI